MIMKIINVEYTKTLPSYRISYVDTNLRLDTKKVSEILRKLYQNTLTKIFFRDSNKFHSFLDQAVFSGL